MKNILTDFLHLFFPNLCHLCQEPLVQNEKHICLNCICRLPYTNYYKEKENPVYQLFIGKADIQQASAFLYFEKGNMVQQLIHQLKYHGYKDIGCSLGRMASQEWGPTHPFEHIDMLVPVPLHSKRKRKRGYNQAEYIARGIHQISKIPIETQVLSRTYSSSSQVHKNLFDRWQNTANLFTVTTPSVIQNKHILLIDDVITSGSTISSCAETLLQVEGVQVSVFGLAVTR